MKKYNILFSLYRPTNYGGSYYEEQRGYLGEFINESVALLFANSQSTADKFGELVWSCGLQDDIRRIYDVSIEAV